MLRNYVRTPAGQRRHLVTPIGPYLDGFAASLEHQGFAFPSVQRDLKTSTAFGEYLVICKKSLQQVSSTDLQEFLQWYRSTPRRHGPRRAIPEGSRALEESLRGSIRKLLQFLRSVGVVPLERTDAPVVPQATLLTEYLRFLDVHRGFAARTVAQHRQWGEALLRSLAASSPSLRLEELTSEAVEAAVAELAAGVGARTAQIISNTVQSFVRYLTAFGHVPATCRPFLPTRRRYALAALPPALEWKLVEKALASIDRSSGQGRRDYAIFLLVATYGLRRSELVGLRLDDIDWRGGLLRVWQSKTRRELHLPLVQPVVDALISHLRDDRPKDSDRHVFQMVHAPRGPISRAAAYAVIRKALIGAGISAPQYGPHLLRHARATSLVQQGWPLKVIGDLLGHRVPEATLIYCKLAVEDLRGVALELPEVE